MKLSYSIWSSSDPVSCNRERWFSKWKCCSRGIEILFSVRYPCTAIRLTFNFVLCINNTNTEFTTIQSCPLYIRSGFHVQAKNEWPSLGPHTSFAYILYRTFLDALNNTVFVKTAQGRWKCHMWRFCEYIGRQRRCYFCKKIVYYKCSVCLKRKACLVVLIRNEIIGRKSNGLWRFGILNPKNMGHNILQWEHVHWIV
jgi:hypothetical protein